MPLHIQRVLFGILNCDFAAMNRYTWKTEKVDGIPLGENERHLNHLHLELLQHAIFNKLMQLVKVWNWCSSLKYDNAIWEWILLWLFDSGLVLQTGSIHWSIWITDRSIYTKTDSLCSNSTNKPLARSQGKILNGHITFLWINFGVCRETQQFHYKLYHDGLPLRQWRSYAHQYMYWYIFVYATQ